MVHDAMASCKGVLLSDWPGSSASGNAVFRPGGGRELEPPGLPPAQKVHPARDSSPKRPTALDKHKRFIHEYTTQLRHEQLEQEGAQQEQQGKEAKVTEFAKQLRQAILSGQDVSSTWKPAAQALATRTQLSQTSQQQAAGLQPTEGIAGALEGNSTDADMLRFVDDLLGQAEVQRSTGVAAEVLSVEAMQEEPGANSTDGAAGVTTQAAGQRCASRSGSPQPGQPPRSAAGPAGTSHSKRPKRPAWALTSGEAAAQAGQEEAELLGFVDTLDFGGYVEDMDARLVQEALQAMRDDGSEGDAASKASFADEEPMGPLPGGGDPMLASLLSNRGDRWKRRFVRAMNDIALRRAAAAAAKDGVAAGEEAEDAAERLTGVRSLRSLGTAAQQQQRDAAGGRPQEWDSRTSVAAPSDVGDKSEVLASCAELASIFPDFKGVHSVASLAALMSREASGLSPQAAATTAGA